MSIDHQEAQEENERVDAGDLARNGEEIGLDAVATIAQRTQGSVQAAIRRRLQTGLVFDARAFDAEEVGDARHTRLGVEISSDGEHAAFHGGQNAIGDVPDILGVCDGLRICKRVKIGRRQERPDPIWHSLYWKPFTGSEVLGSKVQGSDIVDSLIG